MKRVRRSSLQRSCRVSAVRRYGLNGFASFVFEAPLRLGPLLRTDRSREEIPTPVKREKGWGDPGKWRFRA